MIHNTYKKKKYKRDSQSGLVYSCYHNIDKTRKYQSNIRVYFKKTQRLGIRYFIKKYPLLEKDFFLIGIKSVRNNLLVYESIFLFTNINFNQSSFHFFTFFIACMHEFNFLEIYSETSKLVYISN